MATKRKPTKPVQATAEQRAANQDLPQATAFESGSPSWILFPPNLVIPPHKQVIFMRFRSQWTDNPKKGHVLNDENGDPIMRADVPTEPQLWRQVIAWPLNVADKRLALKRSLGDEDRAMDELALQMIRSIDGVAVDWGIAGVQEQFWNECGEKVRRLIRATYHRTHNLTAAESVDFFTSCVVVRSANG
jgi:hypothetical protein